MTFGRKPKKVIKKCSVESYSDKYYINEKILISSKRKEKNGRKNKEENHHRSKQTLTLHKNEQAKIFSSTTQDQSKKKLDDDKRVTFKVSPNAPYHLVQEIEKLLAMKPSSVKDSFTNQYEPFESSESNHYYESFTAPPMYHNQNNSQYTKEYTDLLNALQQYNTDYLMYEDCLSKQGTSCTQPTLNPTIINNLQKYSADISNNFISKKDYQMNATNIQKNYEMIKHLRNELDVNMDTLHKNDTSVLYDYKMEYEGSVYTGILWTVLASSLLFYFFTTSE